MTARSQRERLIAAVDACLSAGLEVYVVAGIPGEGMPIKALQAGWPALTSSPLSLLQR